MELPSTAQPLRLLTIDPGTDQLGIAYLQINIDQQNLIVVDASTFSAAKRLRFDPYYQQLEVTHGSRFARLWIHQATLYHELYRWYPHEVISESPFIGRLHTHAFEALVQCVHSLRETLFHYDPWMQLQLIAPMEAKKAIHRSHRGVMKSDVQYALDQLLNRPQDSGLMIHDDLDWDGLDEHALDAIAVGYARYQQWLSIWRE